MIASFYFLFRTSEVRLKDFKAVFDRHGFYRYDICRLTHMTDSVLTILDFISRLKILIVAL